MFPTLYKLTKTSAIQTYTVSVTANIITVMQGQLNGKKQSYTTTCEGKNIGKANETSPSEQALSEARSKWQKKLDSGYTTDPSGIVSVQLPMKVKTYQDQLANVIFPCTSTPKFNGVNATYTLTPSGLQLTSRGGLAYPPIPHLEPTIKSILSHLGTNRLAGELYIHGAHLQDITSYVKKPKPESAQLHFHIFDLPNIALPYHQRRTLMETIPFTQYATHVPFVTCHSHADLDAHFDACISAGLEGTVIYNHSGLYQYNVRSSDVFKYKKAQDAEFLVVDYTIDKSSQPILTCQTPAGLTFSVKPKGTATKRADILANIQDYLGSWYTVEFETYSKDGIPLKPVGLGLRSCTSTGTPLT